MYIIQMPDGTFLIKGPGYNNFTHNVERATKYATYAEAMQYRPGHHKDMGGSGFKGRPIKYENIAMSRKLFRLEHPLTARMLSHWEE